MSICYMLLDQKMRCIEDKPKSLLVDVCARGGREISAGQARHLSNCRQHCEQIHQHTESSNAQSKLSLSLTRYNKTKKIFT